jgi:exosortase O
MALTSMIFAYAPRPQTGLQQASPAWDFPTALTTEAMPLKPDELQWLTREGAESADRRRFQWGDLRGSMILITSQTWRAHHRPERCFEVYGLSLDDSRTYLLENETPIRLVTLGDGDQRSLLSAAYWFQSADQVTDDYATRIWADLSPERERWVLVSVLFEGVVDPHDAEVQEFYLALQAGVAASLRP